MNFWSVFILQIWKLKVKIQRHLDSEVWSQSHIKAPFQVNGRHLQLVIHSVLKQINDVNCPQDIAALIIDNY